MRNSTATLITLLSIIALIEVSSFSTIHTTQKRHFISKFNNAFFVTRRSSSNNINSSNITRRNMSLASSAVLDSRNTNNRNSNNRKSTSFSQRMRDSLQGPVKKRTTAAPNTRKPKNLHVATTLDEYKALVGDEKESIVIVRFFATWCKACKAIGPSFYRLAHTNPNIKFVEVPVTETNADLHQGLNVPSLPFAHIYHPTGGLVEEMRITKKQFRHFEDVVQQYVNGCCEVIDDDDVLQ